MALTDSARLARENAYAPYSGYHVGAAVEDIEGRVFLGCNVENVSYGASICAERVAITKMISEGSRWIQKIAVSTKDGGTPCGICLQVLLEFAKEPAELEVQTIDDEGRLNVYTLGDLMPSGFQSAEVPRTDRLVK